MRVVVIVLFYVSLFGQVNAQKIYEETGAEYIISTDSSCLMHYDSYAIKEKKNLKVMHLADVLASGWEE